MITVEEKKELKELLWKGNASLLLGAGFSVGAENEITRKCDDGGLKGGLKDLIFEQVIKTVDELDDDDLNEIKTYNLRQMCEEARNLGCDDKLKSLLVNGFKNTVPGKDSFHLNLTKYPWRKIYTFNIDDLVEYIYEHNNKELCVQNDEIFKTIRDGLPVLYKLHGDVNNDKSKFVFSESDYTDLVSKKLDAKLQDLTIEIQNHNMFIIGASLDEPDMNYYLNIYQNAGTKYRLNKLVFINPKPSHAEKQRAKKLDALLIKATTREFLSFISEINYNPSQIEKAKNILNYSGVFSSDQFVDTYVSPYESRLFLGNYCKWQDVDDKWTIETTNFNIAKDKMEAFIHPDSSIQCLCIYGSVFSGKSCLLKQLAYCLLKEGYEILEYKGQSLDIDSICEYINKNIKEKYVLVIDNASHYYVEIERLFSKNIGNKKLIILTASREYYHKKKKYYLEGNDYEAYRFDDRKLKNDADVVRSKLEEKHNLSYMTSYPKQKQIAEIKAKESMINLVFSLTHGDIAKRSITMYQQSFKKFSSSEQQFLVELVIFDLADVGDYPRELFVSKFGGIIDEEDSKLVDYIKSDKNGLSLKNAIINEYVLKNVKEMMKQYLVSVLEDISGYVEERIDNEWYKIFQCLMKEAVLIERFRFTDEEIEWIYLKLQEKYKEVSYYWLQLGLLKQRIKDYTLAYNYLKKSAKIKPYSYQIQHAIARNFLRQANNMDNFTEAELIFERGEKAIKELIESKDYYKEKAKPFSISSYVSEKIKFADKFNLKMSKNEVRYIDNILQKIINTEIGNNSKLCSRFYSYLMKNGLQHYIRFDLNSPYLQGINNDIIEADEIDALIDAI